MASHGYEVGRLLLLYNEIEINITFLTESIYSNQRSIVWITGNSAR